MSRSILKELFLAAMVGCFVAPEAWATLRITEICPRPDALDPNGKEAGWIELQNQGEEAISLSNYGLVRVNRGKEIKSKNIKAFPDALDTLNPGDRIVIYTSEEYPNADGETFEVYLTEDPNEPQIAVFPFKVNPKKFPTVRLYRGSTPIQTLMVPVDLKDNKSFGPGTMVDVPLMDAQSVYDYTVTAVDEVLATGQGQGAFAVVEKAPIAYVSGDVIASLAVSNSVAVTDGVYDFRAVSRCQEGLHATLDENTTLTDGFAVSLWFKTAQTTVANDNNEGKGMVLFECRPSPGPNNNNAGINLFIDGEKMLRVQPRSAGKATTNLPTNSPEVTDEEWHHVVLTGGQKAGEVITAYCDGKEVLSSELEHDIDLQLDYVCFGRAYNSRSWLPYIGQLKEMAFYPRVLSAKDVESLMASTLALEAETTSLSLVGVEEADGVVTFDGSKAVNAAYIADATVDFATGETVDFWVKPTSFEGAGQEATVLVDCRPAGGNTTGYLLLRKDDGTLYVQRATGLSSVKNVEYAGALTLNAWNHVTFTLDPETDVGTLYINGVKMEAKEIEGYTPSAIGRRFGGTYDSKGWWRGVIGQMADVRVFSQVLDATEIAKLHNAKAEARGCAFVKGENLSSDADTIVNVDTVEGLTFAGSIEGSIAQAATMFVSVSPATAEVNCSWNGAPVNVGEAFDVEAGDYSFSWTAEASDEPVLVTVNKRVEAGVMRVILPTLTKGVANDYTGAIAVGPQVGPAVGTKASGDAFTMGMTFSSNPAKTTEDLVVTYTVHPFSDDGSIDEANAITGVGLRYQIGFGEEIVVPMASEDGITWKATILTADLQPGQLIRCAAEITEATGACWRSPSLNNLDDCPSWYGTIVEPTESQVSATLQTFHLFADAAALADMDLQYDSVSGRNPLGARVGIYDWNSKTYYDNVRIDLRGNTSAHFAKKSHGLRFNKCQPLIFDHPFDGEEIEVRKTSFTAEWPDPSFLRQSLSFHVWRNAGALVPFHYPVRLQLNGAFYQMAFHTNRFTDELIEDYYGLDPMGYAYKNVGTFNANLQTSAGGIEKKTPDDGDETSAKAMAPLQAFVNRFTGVTAIDEDAYAELPEVTKVVVQHFDLPAWINYLSIARITQETDDSWANISAYYDINGTNTWMPLAYDHNLSFGAWYVGDEGNPVKDSMRIGTRAKADNFKSHPFYGGTRVRAHRLDGATVGRANNAIEAVWQSEKFRRLYLRRLRTLMDEVLMAPGTKDSKTPFWTYVTTMQEAMQADAALDRSTNGYGDKTVIYAWQAPMSLDEGIADMWENYVVPRREHLFYNHVAVLEEGQTRDDAYLTREVGYGTDMIAGIPAKQSPIADLAAKITVKDGFDAAAGVLVLQNANEETIDMSGWKLSGAVSWTIPAGTVIDAQIDGVPGEVYIVADRNAYVTENESDLTNQVIIGNADFTSAETLSLIADDGTPVILGDPTVLQNYLRVAAVYSSTLDGGDNGKEFIDVKNMSDSETLNLKGVTIIACKNGDPWEAAKCNFTIDSDVLVAPGATVRLDQATYATYGWNKLTNGKVDMKVYDPDGVVLQTLFFSAGWWKQADEGGAWLVATDFGTVVTEQSQWKPSFEVPTNEDAKAALDAVIAERPEVIDWLNGFSDTDRETLVNFTGTQDDITKCWLVNVPLCEEPAIELTVTSMTFSLDGTINVTTKLVVNGVEREGTVNGTPVLIGYETLTSEGEEITTVGKSLPFNLDNANAEKSYRFFRVRIR